MPKLTIDGQEVEVPPGATVLQACETLGIEVPRFCYHERLSVAGNCRMCLVEQEKAPKPIASCAMPAADNMVIKTNTPMVRKARRGVMEFLLINHPLDCPICDQGGECDLQDQAMAYGFDHSRYAENKRAVTEKFMGPLVKTVMTRCIHCTRCVRFATEVAGVPEIGAIGRGENMQITTYLEQALTSELQGNVIDLCPVGALTSKPYAFVARPWELRKTETVDVHDALGSAIRVDARGREVLRVLPRIDEEINEEWISDKTRFAVDGLRRQRLDRPYVRECGKLKPATWGQAFEAIRARLDGVPGSRIGGIVGDLAAVEEIAALKDLLVALGSPNLDARQDGAAADATQRASYIFNSGIAGIDKADALILIGSNPRREAPVLNARIRKRYLKGRFPIGRIGPASDLTYKVTELGDDLSVLDALADGSHAFAEVLKGAERPMLILGAGALARADGLAVLAAAQKAADALGLVKDGWNGFNVLQTAASRVGALDLGFVPGEGGLDRTAMLDAAGQGALDVLFLLGADELPMDALEKPFVVYVGTHGDHGAHVADVILPGAAYTEKNGIYVNTEGRPQLGNRAIFPPGDAREDWAIFRALSDVLGKRLPYDSISQLRARIAKDAPHLLAFDRVTPANWAPFGAAGPVAATKVAEAVADFYLTNPIARASTTMAECSRLARDLADGHGHHHGHGHDHAGERTGTHG